MWQQRTRDLCLFYFTDFEQVFGGWVIYFIFFFSLLTIDHKHKCIQHKTLETQASWSLHSKLINYIIQVCVLAIMTKKKLRKICGTKMLQYHGFPDIWKLFYSICMWNMTPDETLCMKLFKKKNKGTLITSNDINK